MGDLLGTSAERRGAADFDQLIDLIVTTISTDEWSDSGSPISSIRPFPANDTLVVSCCGATHDQLRLLFQQLRVLKYELPSDFAAKVREAEARKRTSPVIIKAFAKLQQSDQDLLNNQFQAGISQLSRDYGAPQCFQAGEVGFPDWATAQQIAIWDRRGGRLYFALQDCRPHGEAIVAGWWEDSFGVQQPLKLATD
ncbi:MAG: hypothetical protein KDA37_16330 [Planctomycetales bacterium]|nr:hypothetical protein [Planctomycetales bacterium]